MPASAAPRPPALYDALVDAGAPPESALDACRAMYRAKHLDGVGRDLRVLTWMVAAALLLNVAVLASLFVAKSRLPAATRNTLTGMRP